MGRSVGAGKLLLKPRPGMLATRRHYEESPMGYVEKVLQPEESVVYKTTVHWFVYVRGVIFALVSIIIFMLSFRFEETGRWVMQWITLIFVAVAVAFAFIGWVQRFTTELAITTKRVIYKTGLMKRQTFEMNRNSVESVGVEQSVLGRIMGYGKVELKGTGASSQHMPLIHDPLRFRSHITAS
jgi:uncharacterized membrane protein YdbT with pleckstrin-like domain